MLGGRQGSYRPQRHSVIYMWISTPNNFVSLIVFLPCLVYTHSTCKTPSLSPIDSFYQASCPHFPFVHAARADFYLFAGFMSNSFMFNTPWITWNWLLPHITFSFHRRKNPKNYWHFTQLKFTSAFLTKANYVQLCSVLSFLHMLGYCGEELTLPGLKYLNLRRVVHCTRGKKEYPVFSCVHQFQTLYCVRFEDVPS